MDNCILKNKNGVELEVIPFGAAVTALKIPLKNDELIDVVLGFESDENYRKSFEIEGAPYFGATVGRFAGRINKGMFSVNDNTYQLQLNNNGNSLHGGAVGFSQKVWKILSHSQGDNPSVTFEYLSPNLEENYPGDLQVIVTYSLSEDNEVTINYRAESSEDTIINLTHHSYFNLEGHGGSIENQELYVNATKMVATDDTNIPSGKLIDLKGTAFDFSKVKKCPTSIDNTFVVTDNQEVAARLISKKNGLQMEVITTQPGIHIYVGGDLSNKLKGKENVNYHALSGICFETQNFPDAPNHEHFPSAILHKGEIYSHKTVYKFQNIEEFQ